MHHRQVTMAGVMSPFPWSIEASDLLSRAENLMTENNIHHLAVTVNGTLESIISQRDISRASSPGHSLQEEEYLVSDFAAPRAWFADIHDPLEKVLDVMVETHIGAVLVLKDGELAGIFTDKDACQLLSASLKAGEFEPPDQPA